MNLDKLIEMENFLCAHFGWAVSRERREDALTRLEAQYCIQKARIKILHDKMREYENVEASLQTEVDRGWSMLDDIAKLQMNMGILEK